MIKTASGGQLSPHHPRFQGTKALLTHCLHCLSFLAEVLSLNSSEMAGKFKILFVLCLVAPCLGKSSDYYFFFCVDLKFLTFKINLCQLVIQMIPLSVI